MSRKGCGIENVFRLPQVLCIDGKGSVSDAAHVFQVQGMYARRFPFFSGPPREFYMGAYQKRPRAALVGRLEDLSWLKLCVYIALDPELLVQVSKQTEKMCLYQVPRTLTRCSLSCPPALLVPIFL